MLSQNPEYADELLSYETKTYRQAGKDIQRTIYLMPAELGVEKSVLKQWSSLNTIVRVITTTRVVRNKLVEKEPSVSVRDYISSKEIDPDNLDFAKKMLNLVLNRWDVEVDHWYLDLVFDQDRIPLRNKQYAQTNAILTKFAKNIVSYTQKVLPDIDSSHHVSLEQIRSVCCRNMSTEVNMLTAFATKDDSYILEDPALIRCGLVKGATYIPEENNQIIKEFEKDIESIPLAKFIKERYERNSQENLK